jgi:hypothetical protein
MLPVAVDLRATDAERKRFLNPFGARRPPATDYRTARQNQLRGAAGKFATITAVP